MKKAIVIALGLAASFAAGYGASTLYLKKKYEKAIEDNIEAVKKEYAEKEISRRNSDAKNLIDITVSKSYGVRRLSNDRAVIVDDAPGMDAEEAKQVIKDYAPSEDDTDIVDEMDRIVVNESLNRKKNAPKLIKEDLYGSDGFDMECLFFYQEDGVVVEEDGSPVENYETILGDCMYKFDFINNSQDRIYVRNTERHTDYEIVKQYMAFYGN